MMENTSYGTIIGNSNAPQINALANTYGLATNYFGVTHPSEPNYVANVGGSYFGIQDDNQFYCTPALATSDPNCGGTTVNHTVSAPSIADQLTAANMTWKGYFQSLPPTPTASYVMTGTGANGPYTFKYPSNAVALYASKHNPFINFTGTQGAVSNMVPDTQLATDLASSSLPNYSLIVPDQCHDMHGTGGCSDTNSLISAGDAYVGATVDQIMDSSTWKKGNNAIVVTWDEDDYSDSGRSRNRLLRRRPRRRTRRDHRDHQSRSLPQPRSLHQSRPLPHDRRHRLQPLFPPEEHGGGLWPALPCERRRLVQCRR